MEGQIFPQHRHVVKAPGQERAVLPAPAAKPLHRFGKGDALGLEPGFLNTGQLADPLVELADEFGPDQNLKFIGHRPVGQQPHGADLDDLAMGGDALPGRRRSGPCLVPFHVQNDILHRLTPYIRWNHHIINSMFGQQIAKFTGTGRFCPPLPHRRVCRKHVPVSQSERTARRRSRIRKSMVNIACPVLFSLYNILQKIRQYSCKILYHVSPGPSI